MPRPRLPTLRSSLTLIVLAMLAVYVRAALASPWPFAITLPPDVLIAHGGNLPAGDGGAWWRAAVALVLNVGPVHLLFDLATVTVVVTLFDELYGKAVTLLAFVGLGTVAALASSHLGIHGVEVGASAGTMALVTMGAAAGHRVARVEGGWAGRRVRDDLLRFAVLVLLFTFVTGGDIRAALAGGVVGAPVGWLVPASTFTSRRPLAIVVAVLGGLALAAITAAALIPATRWGG